MENFLDKYVIETNLLGEIFDLKKSLYAHIGRFSAESQKLNRALDADPATGNRVKSLQGEALLAKDKIDLIDEFISNLTKDERR